MDNCKDDEWLNLIFVLASDNKISVNEVEKTCRLDQVALSYQKEKVYRVRSPDLFLNIFVKYQRTIVTGKACTKYI